MDDHDIATRITAALLLPEIGQQGAAIRDLIDELVDEEWEDGRKRLAELHDEYRDRLRAAHEAGDRERGALLDMERNRDAWKQKALATRARLRLQLTAP